MAHEAELETRDYVIVGAGPAGLQLGYYLEQAGRDYVILEAEEGAGSAFKRYPRHRKLLSINKIYCGYDERELQMRWDWNSLLGPDHDPLFSAYTRDYFPDASALVRYLGDYARRHKLNIKYRTRVQSIDRWIGSNGKQCGYRLEDQDGKAVYARRLVVASGFTKTYEPPIDGIELTESYATMSVQPEDFADQRVLIIGKGNSAFETADCLIPSARVIHLASPHPVEFAWRSHYVGNLRAVNNNFLDTYQLKLQNAVLDAHIDCIQRECDEYKVRFRYIHNTETEELTYDRVLTCAGFRFDPTIFGEDCQPNMRDCGRLPLMNEGWESVNLSGLFFAGVLTQMRDYRRSSSAFIHGFRYNARALFRMLEQKYEGVPWPAKSIETTPEAFTDAMLHRINTSSALWQQFGYLCDVIVCGPMGPSTYLEEIPLDYVLAHEALSGDECFTVTLEYGTQKRIDPFRQSGRVVRTDAAHAGESAFLHPVIRHYCGGELVATHHVIEDLAAEWKEEEHVGPLHDFFWSELGYAKTRPHTFIRDLLGGSSTSEVG